LLAFDAPTREECVAERNRSMIPQQALVLQNDPTYVEASRAFASKIINEGGAEAETRIKWAWRQALCRLPTADEISAIDSLLKKNLAEYAKDTEAAKKLISVGFSKAPENIDPAELAAW